METKNEKRGVFESGRMTGSRGNPPRTGPPSSTDGGHDAPAGWEISRRRCGRISSIDPALCTQEPYFTGVHDLDANRDLTIHVATTSTILYLHLIFCDR